jgi:hypothetical protein
MRVAQLALIVALTAGPADAQNQITQDGWEGFAMRGTTNNFDRCVLYNRTIQALSATPYEMLGITRDAAGRIGLLVFYDPRALTRGKTTVRIKLDQRAPAPFAGDALSDFHVDVPALDADTVAALRNAKTMDATTGSHTIHFDLSNVAGVLERLDACVKIYGPKS